MPVAKLPGIMSAEHGVRLSRRRLFPSRHGGWRAPAGTLLLGLGLGAALGCFAQDGRPAESPASKPPSSSTAKTAPQNGDGLVSVRKRQISDESSQLLAMALSLKAEVDKTNKDTLSLKVIRKADQIERLAKSVKERAKQAGPTG